MANPRVAGGQLGDQLGALGGVPERNVGLAGDAEGAVAQRQAGEKSRPGDQMRRPGAS